MAKKVRSLQDQIAELSNVDPGAADLDPETDEEAYDAIRNEGDDSEGDLEDEARNHARHNYADLAPSILRRRANHLEGLDDEQMKKYQGIKSTRKELMSDSDSDEDEDEDEDEDASEDSRQENGKNVELDSEEDEVTEGSEDEEDSDTEMQIDEDGEKEDQEDVAIRPLKKNTVRFEDSSHQLSEFRPNAAQTDAQLLQELRKRSREDAEKGRDARKQMDLWSKLLGVRIRGQKVVRGAGRISTKVMKESLPTLEKADREAYDSTLSALDDMSSHLFLVQRLIMGSFTNADSKEGATVSAALDSIDAQLEQVSQSRNQSNKDGQQIDQHLDTLFELDKVIFEPLWREILARWTSRTSVTSLVTDPKNKFESSLKAMNQSAEDQIGRGLTGDTFDRLRKRTRVWRGTEQENRIVERQISKDPDPLLDDDDDDEAEGQKEECDIFDDSDFYAAMLRELIDSRGGSSLTGTETSDSSLAWAQAAKRVAKKNKNADLKSSKGRKLRYDVMEKVEHFMPPIPRETWTKEQMNRLFRQLKQSSGTANDASIKDDSEITEQERVELAGLRLFG